MEHERLKYESITGLIIVIRKTFTPLNLRNEIHAEFNPYYLSFSF